MDTFDAKLRENDFPVNQTIFLSEDNRKQPRNVMKDDDFPFEVSNSSKPTIFPQDFQPLDQFHVHGSSSNAMFGVQAACYDPFDPYSYCRPSNNEIEFCECKPFADSMNGGHGHVMDNFQCGDDHPYLNIHQGNVFDHVAGSGQNHVMIPFDYPEIIKPVNFIMPDEVSCASAENDCYKRVDLNKNKALAARKTWKGRKKSNVVKGQWTIDEDRLLMQLVEQHGIRKWSHIAQMLPGRIGKQCRERWHNHLRPDIKKDIWSEEEDKVLIQAHTEIGNKWAEIAKRLPGRTENSIKNHWNATKRRQFSKRKCRSKYPRGSLLQDYIKSLNLDPSTSARGRHKEKSSNNNKKKKDGSNSVVHSGNDNKRDNNQQTEQKALEFYRGDGLVPEYMFKEEVQDFSFDDKLFGEGCSIDSLLEELPDAPMDASKVVVDGEGGVALMDLEVKKEMDLVEMIFQANVQ